MILGIDASRANREQKTGVEWYAFFIIQNLKKIVPADWEVRLYTDKPLAGELAILPNNWQEVVLNWPPKRLWTQVRLSWEMLRHTPDILFVPAHVPPMIHPKQTVLMVHDVAAKNTPGAYNWFEKWYSMFTAEEAITKLPSILVPTLAVKNDLLQLFPKVNEAKIQVVHHGINPIFFSEPNQSEGLVVLEKYKLSKPYVVAVGRIETKKNSAGLVEAFAEACRLGYTGKLVLVGKPGHGYEAVERAIKKNKVSELVLIIPWVENTELVTIVREAQALMFPSLAEGFGLPILEAMALGVPVVASDLPVLREVAGNAAHFVPPNHTTALAKAILETGAAVHQARFRHLGKARASQFSWEISAQNTLVILQNLVKPEI